jgi:cytochrome P450
MATLLRTALERFGQPPVARRRAEAARKARGLKGLPPGPTEPALVQVLRWVRWPIAFMRDARAVYGDTFTIRFPQTPPLVVFSHPDAIKEIFTGDPEIFHAGEANTILEPVMGPRSLLMLDEKPHLRERRLLLPPFHGERMHAYGRTMREITLTAAERIVPGRVTRFHDLTQDITLDVILRTVFGVDAGEHERALREALRVLLDVGSSPVLLFPIAQLDLGPRSPWGRMKRLLAEVDRLLYAQIRARREGRGASSRDDVLAMLIDARHDDGSAMTDDELRDEMVTMLIAGHETTATTLAWMFHELATHPDAQVQAHAEIDRVAVDGLVAPARIGELTYLDAVTKETLRLDPVVPMVGRLLTRPVTIAGVSLPAGVAVAPNIWLAQRRAQEFPRPDRFDPQRFVGVKANPYTWLPFGGGVRRCLGMAFAMYEIKMVAATLLARFSVRPAPDEPIHLVRRAITFAPSGSAPLVFTRRA